MNESNGVVVSTFDVTSMILELDEARESYRLANRRIIELLDEKMALAAKCEQLFSGKTAQLCRAYARQFGGEQGGGDVIGFLLNDALRLRGLTPEQLGASARAAGAHA